VLNLKSNVVFTDRKIRADLDKLYKFQKYRMVQTETYGVVWIVGQLGGSIISSWMDRETD
jgi:hypothetical protein